MKSITYTFLILILSTACSSNRSPGQTIEPKPRSNMETNSIPTSVQFDASPTPTMTPIPTTKENRINSHAKIAFVGYENYLDPTHLDATAAQSGIYVLDLGSNQIKHLSSLIPYYGSQDGAFIWSPDAMNFAFLADSERIGIANPEKKVVGLWVANLETSEVNLVFPITNQEEITNFKWSPDGSRLAFIYNNSTPQNYISEIIVINKDGSGRKPIHINIKNMGGGENLYWFPDGNRLAVTSLMGVGIITTLTKSGEPVIMQYGSKNDHFQPFILSPKLNKVILADGGYDKARNLYMSNLDGTGFRKISNSPNYYFNPDWSSDGSRISVEFSKDLGLIYQQLGMMKPDDNDFLQLTKNTDSWFMDTSISPDGQRILVKEWVNDVNKNNHFWRIYMIGADGELLYPNIVTDLKQFNEEPLFSWLPDVQVVLITKNPPQFFNYQTGELIDFFNDMEVKFMSDLSLSPK